MLRIDVANCQERLAFDEERLRAAVAEILTEHAVRDGVVSLAVVDDQEMRELNRRHLGHNYATDVLSFPLDRCDASLEAEIIVSADTALASAEEFGWSGSDELLLYVIHGTLHLVGFDDHDEESATAMRAHEARWLARWGLPAHVSSGPSHGPQATPTLAPAAKRVGKGSQ